MIDIEYMECVKVIWRVDLKHYTASRRNYGPTIRVQKIAESKGCNQVLWLLGKEEQVRECTPCSPVC